MKIKRITVAPTDVYDITVPQTENFFANDILVHNCQEIGLPTEPLSESGDGQIALCTLSALNWGKIDTEKQMAEAAELAVRGLDELLTYQEYPNEFAKRNVENYRPLGVGIIGFAHWLAKNNLVWGRESEQQVQDKIDSMMYHLISTSVDLAEVSGPCLKETKYHDGIMPGTSERWAALAERAKRAGIRNACLAALMPSETSSTLANETNGIEPPKDLVTIKGSKDGVMSQVVPGITRYSQRYQKAWDVPVQDYLYTVGVLQRYVDQAISANTSYNPHKVEVTTSVLVKDLLEAYKCGVKTLYYNNTLDDAPDDSADCESCKI